MNFLAGLDGGDLKVRVTLLKIEDLVGCVNRLEEGEKNGTHVL